MNEIIKKTHTHTHTHTRIFCILFFLFFCDTHTHTHTHTHLPGTCHSNGGRTTIRFFQTTIRTHLTGAN